MNSRTLDPDSNVLTSGTESMSSFTLLAGYLSYYLQFGIGLMLDLLDKIQLNNGLLNWREGDFGRWWRNLGENLKLSLGRLIDSRLVRLFN